MNRLAATACLLAFVLSGCAARMPFPDEIEAWGYEPPQALLR